MEGSKKKQQTPEGLLNRRSKLLARLWPQPEYKIFSGKFQYPSGGCSFDINLQGVVT